MDAKPEALFAAIEAQGGIREDDPLLAPKWGLQVTRNTEARRRCHVRPLSVVLSRADAPARETAGGHVAAATAATLI